MLIIVIGENSRTAKTGDVTTLDEQKITCKIL